MTIDLDDAAFDRGRAGVREAAQRLGTARERADQRVTGFVGAGWRGVAATAFVSAWQEWQLAARDVEQGLVAIAQLMDATHRDLHSCDAAARSRLDVVAAHLGQGLG
jgi:WXG100 family type VII secretion target